MHSSITLLTASLSLLTPLTSAIITSISVPATIAPKSTIPITLITANYIQTVADVAIAFGLTPSTTKIPYNESVGSTLLGSFYLGPQKSNIITNITTSVEVPEGFPAGDAVFNGMLYSLYGAEYEPIIKNFTVGVTVGGATNGDVKASVV